MQIKQCLILFTFLLVINPAFAVNIFECEDANGNITFQDRCPPGTTPVNQRTYGTNTTDATESGPVSPLMLYAVPDCDTCDQLKEFLQVRNLGYTEIDVSSDIELQTELKEIAGELQVPTLIIGDKVLTGYNRTQLRQTLTESGHITD
jgi:glutaredoxin